MGTGGASSSDGGDVLMGGRRLIGRSGSRVGSMSSLDGRGGGTTSSSLTGVKSILLALDGRWGARRGVFLTTITSCCKESVLGGSSGGRLLARLLWPDDEKESNSKNSSRPSELWSA